MMKILYAIQGTGNGHLSRARDIIPILQQKAELDILVSGIQADVELPYPVKYRFKGLSFIFGKSGGIDLLATYRKSNLKQLYNEIKSLPIEEYDLVINDFEPVSAWACKMKHKECVGLSHQAAVINKKSPKPKKKDMIGRAVLHNYAPVTAAYGFHFGAYDKDIFTPVIRNQIRTAKPENKMHYTVYLPAYSDEKIIKVLGEIKNINWQVFSKHTKKEYSIKNIHIRPINNEAFIDSFINCTGVLCGAGFETPAEALFLKKKLLVIPMKGQYEQQCNAAALKTMSVPVIKSLKKKHLDTIRAWVAVDQQIIVNYPDTTQRIINMVIKKHGVAEKKKATELGEGIYSIKKLITRNDFGDDFKWGVSTAAYQIEGAHNIDGKGPSIWDTFTQRKKKIFNNDNGNIACDYYKHYAEDIALIYKLNIPNHRFSISWSRILPNGIGAVNHKGIDFYNRVIDFCLELGIEPWITLYHWDLPEALQQKGGWTNREVINWFSYFVDCCIKNFGDRVKYWMVLNEPMVFTGAGYFLGVHAPGKKGLSSFLAAAHHAALCQAEGGRIIKSLRPDAKVGTTFSYSHIEPYRYYDERDIKAAVKVDALLNRMFIEPLLGLGYPTRDLKILERIERFMLPQDEKKLAFDMDFIGLQNYTREFVSYAPLMPFVKARIIKASKRNVEHTLMDWEVYPPGIYNALKRLHGYGTINEIIVTENGAAFNDSYEEDKVDDYKRVKFLQDYIAQVLLAKREGVKVNGYFIWTLLDNFEWAEGYYPKFGIVHVDFRTQRRIIKTSGSWYSQFLKNTLAASREIWNEAGIGTI